MAIKSFLTDLTHNMKGLAKHGWPRLWAGHALVACARPEPRLWRVIRTLRQGKIGHIYGTASLEALNNQHTASATGASPDRRLWRRHIGLACNVSRWAAALARRWPWPSVMERKNRSAEAWVFILGGWAPSATCGSWLAMLHAAARAVANSPASGFVFGPPSPSEAQSLVVRKAIRKRARVSNKVFWYYEPRFGRCATRNMVAAGQLIFIFIF